MASDEVEKFCTKMCKREDTHEIALYALSADHTRVLLESWEAPFDPVDQAEAIEERALRQANTLGGNHAFFLGATTKSGKALGSEIFRVSAEALPGSAGIVSTEPPNEVGHYSQMMRHNEAMFRSTVMGFDKLLRHSIASQEVSAKRADMSEERYLKGLEVISAVVTQEHESKVALLKAENRSAIQKQFASKIAGLLPTVAAAFTEKQAPGGKMAAAVVGARGFFESINAEQMQQILGLLNDGQKATLFDFLRRISDESQGVESEQTH